MAKASYRTPVSLDRSMADHEIKLATWLPVVSIKQLGFLAGGIFLIFWAVSSTYLQNAGMGWRVLLTIWGLILVFYLGARLGTKELRLGQVPISLNYLPSVERKVMTRRHSNPSQFSAIVGIQSIDDDGRIHFGDGGHGQVFLVVGTASRLLFDEDSVYIIDRNDHFWRKVDEYCEWSIITRKEPQRIYHQTASLARRNANLEVRDPDLISLQNEQYDILTNFVGGQFSSIHQYVLLKGVSEDALNRGYTVLRSEVENSNLVIREASMLDRDETLSMLQVFYQGVLEGGPRSKIEEGE